MKEGRGGIDKRKEGDPEKIEVDDVHSIENRFSRLVCN
jgi:hypothetical protein